MISLVLSCWDNVNAQAPGKVEQPSPSPPSQKDAPMMEGDLKSLLTNAGALGVLGLLVWRLPQIFQIINDGKKEIALIMKDIQGEAYTNYATNLNLVIKNSDTRVEKLEQALTKVTEVLSTLSAGFQVLMDRDKK
jgi:hypothetical protein